MRKYAQNRDALLPGLYHHLAWKEAFAVYGLETCYLSLQRRGQPRGVLPMVKQHSRLFGNRLISLPWVDEAGAVGDPTAIHELLNHAGSLAARFGPSYSVVIRQPIDCELSPPEGWLRDEGDKVLMRLSLPDAPEQLWESLSPKARNQVRKADKSGLVTAQGGVETLPDFYEVYSENMRDLGQSFSQLVLLQGPREWAGKVG